MARKLLVFMPLIATGVAAGFIPLVTQDRLAAFPVSITVDAGKSLGLVKPIWRFFGADEPNYATEPNGEKLIGELGSFKKGQVYFRAHNLMTTGDGKPALKWGSTNLYTEDAHGRPIYDFRIVDKIFDTYLKHGVRPYLEIGFMPQALSTHPTPYQHVWTPRDSYDAIFTGWAYPPTDYAKWEEIVYQWAKHCVDRYGKREVEKWYWEVWNEPNYYFKASKQEFFRLHDTAVNGVRRALPTARVGGPDTAGAGGYFSDSLTHFLKEKNLATGKTGTPTDFVSFHAKGAPEFVNGHVRMGIANQLRTMDDGFARVAANPELKNTPIVIGESDPDGCAACQGPQLGYRNGLMYASYTAASFPRAIDLARARGVNLEGALTWAFEFEGFDSFAGFRQLATNGVDLPVLNVFRMLSKMKGDAIAATSDHQVPLDAILKGGVRSSADVGVSASRDGDMVAILVWHYHDDDVVGPSADISLDLKELSPNVRSMRVREYRIDETHSNAYTAWLKMGSPKRPTDSQTKQLEQAAKLTTASGPAFVDVEEGSARLHLNLPRQAVSLVVLSPN